MSGPANAFASIMREVNMPDKNWYMEFPHGKWMKRITALISEYTFHGYGFDETYRWVLTMPPKNGWDSETLSFVKTAIRLALRECWHDR